MALVAPRAAIAEPTSAPLPSSRAAPGTAAPTPPARAPRGAGRPGGSGTEVSWTAPLRRIWTRQPRPPPGLLGGRIVHRTGGRQTRRDGRRPPVGRAYTRRVKLVVAIVHHE